MPRNYHRAEDTVDAIDMSMVVRAADFGAAVALDALQPGRAPRATRPPEGGVRTCRRRRSASGRPRWRTSYRCVTPSCGPGLPLATAHFDGDDDPTTIHLAAVLDADDAVVGCATLMARPYRDHPAWQLRGMATRADLARRGVGRAVLAAAEELVRERGGPLVLWCNARLAAVPFYASGGWQVVSAEFDIPGVGPAPRHGAGIELRSGRSAGLQTRSACGARRSAEDRSTRPANVDQVDAGGLDHARLSSLTLGHISSALRTCDVVAAAAARHR